MNRFDNSASTPTAKYLPGQEVRGKRHGRFVIAGSRWCEAVGEYVYGVFQINDAGDKISREMNLVESCFQ